MVDASTTNALHSTGVAPWLLEKVAGLARGDAQSLEAVLTAVGTSVTLAGTKAHCRCHFVTFDGNGRPRVDALIEKLAWQVRDYCIPRSRIAEANRHFEQTGSTEQFSALEHEARGLFVKLEKSGEGGELLLYLLLEMVLGLPQLLCKMPLKTSTQMHVHGVDGVHGKLLPGGNLAMYWGESKLYAKVNDGIDACFESLAPYLLDTSSGAAQRDLLLVRDHFDPGDEGIKQALVKYFDDSQPESARIEFRGACLVGFMLEDYPDPTSIESVRGDLATQIAKWKERIQRRIGVHRLESFELEVFCVPLPSVEEFRDKLRERLALR